jgi:fatty acid desaturase
MEINTTTVYIALGALVAGYVVSWWIPIMLGIVAVPVFIFQYMVNVIFDLRNNKEK